MEGFLNALLLQSGYNAALVGIGAALLGMAAGGTGTFIFLRKRSLVSDAAAHATLPGICLAFMAMVAFGGDGRNLTGLMVGSAGSAAVALVLVDWISRETRLPEDAAIGAVLSVFFGFGIVLMTVIQTMTSGRQAGLESFLLGSTAGMLFNEAVTIAIAGAVAGFLLLLLHRRMTLVAFDPEFAATTGIDVRATDLATMGLVLVVTVIGLKVVGLVLIVAMLIIPAVAARFWTERVDRLVAIAAVIGGVSGYTGAAASAAYPNVPTGAVIVLISFGLFAVSLSFAPVRGVVASVYRHVRFQRQVHLRQGLLAVARGEPIFDGLTLKILRFAGHIRADGVATLSGRAAAAKALRDEARWEVARETHQEDVSGARYDGLTAIETVFTPDEIAEFDRRIGDRIGVVA
ncbi:MAG: zinc ABC transporter permease [Alphaproteobacteria bacterium BRH_c36]|nr:MAG: zinc ABC transporter permease [Alphaproteobacteria bacterium BRH_c36]